MEQFGDTLRAIRQSLNLSQGDLALELSSTQRHISFLETGRSEPSRAMLGRLTTELPLNATQRSALRAASPFKTNEQPRDLSAPEMIETLDMLEHRLLAHWPFPGFVLSNDWTVLRNNIAAERLFSLLAPPKSNTPRNLLVLLTSDSFRSLVANWEEASASLFFRLQQNARHNDVIKAHFTQLKANGVFDHVASHTNTDDAHPIFTALELVLPNGARIRTTSVVGKLGTVHDSLIEGLEIELLMPVDAASEAIMQAAASQ